MNEIAEVLSTPLYEHPDGLVTGLEEAAQIISARVDAWAEEVTA